jgi:hypothetical protein
VRWQSAMEQHGRWSPPGCVRLSNHSLFSRSVLGGGAALPKRVNEQRKAATRKMPFRDIPYPPKAARLTPSDTQNERPSWYP